MLQLEPDKVQEEKMHVEDENERLRRMTPSVTDTDVVCLVSTELVERLGERLSLRGDLQAGSTSTTVQGAAQNGAPRTIDSERIGEVKEARQKRERATAE